MISFETFIKAPGTEKALKAFKDMLDNDCKPLLLCIGGVGCGKTHLCYALSSAYRDKGILCPVEYWSEFIIRLKDTMEKQKVYDSGAYKPSYFQLIDKLRKRDYVIIDDVGLGSTGSEWEWGVFEEILNYKYDRIVYKGNRLVMIVTTNKTLEELPPRVVRRFSDPKAGRIVANKGEDYTRKCIKTQ